MDPALDAALDKKNLKALQKVLLAQPDLTALDSSGLPALHRAVLQKKLELAEALLAAGSSLEVKDDDGNPPLYRLLKSKSGEMNALEQENARWLIEKGADLNAPGDYGASALHFAASTAPVAFLEYLFERGAKVLRDEGGNTPLLRCLSTRFKDEGVWKLLLARGCAATDVNAQLETPVHRAVTNHNQHALKFFLALGVDPAAKDVDGKTALDGARSYNPKALALLERKVPARGGAQ